MGDIIGIKDAAALLDVSTVTLWRWAKAGDIQYAFKVRKQYLFNRAAIQALAEKRAQQPQAVA